MLRNLLQQEGITTFVQGEHLQSGVGVLPAGGLVRLVVDEADYAEARTVIDRWETTLPSEPAPAVMPVLRPRSTLKGIFIGLAMGLACSYAFFKVPSNSNGLDHNGDGVLDEKWTYSLSGAILKYEADRNFDGKIDLIGYYDKRSVMERSDSDDDFNGTFETRNRYRQGNIELSETDTNGDGSPDLSLFYSKGVIYSSKYINPASGLPVRVEYYKLGKFTNVDVDTDKDGTLDTRYIHNTLGEVIGTEKIVH